jgi:hypothetical protein
MRRHLHLELFIALVELHELAVFLLLRHYGRHVSPGAILGCLAKQRAVHTNKHDECHIFLPKIPRQVCLDNTRAESIQYDTGSVQDKFILCQSALGLRQIEVIRHSCCVTRCNRKELRERRE